MKEAVIFFTENLWTTASEIKWIRKKFLEIGLLKKQIYFVKFWSKRLLRKFSTKEVFEEILNEFQERLLGDNYQARNSESFKGKKEGNRT